LDLSTFDSTLSSVKSNLSTHNSKLLRFDSNLLRLTIKIHTYASIKIKNRLDKKQTHKINNKK